MIWQVAGKQAPGFEQFLQNNESFILFFFFTLCAAPRSPPMLSSVSRQPALAI